MQIELRNLSKQLNYAWKFRNEFQEKNYNIVNARGEGQIIPKMMPMIKPNESKKSITEVIEQSEKVDSKSLQSEEKSSQIQLPVNLLYRNNQSNTDK